MNLRCCFLLGLFCAPQVFGQKDRLLTEEQLATLSFTNDLLTRFSDASGLISSWVGAGNGGYLLRANVDLTGDGKPEFLIASSLELMDGIVDWSVYGRDSNGNVQPYDKTFVANVANYRPGLDPQKIFVIADPRGWNDDGLRVNRFLDFKIVESVLPHAANEGPEAGNAFDRGEIWSPKKLSVEGIKLSDYVSGGDRWKEINFDAPAPSPSGYFIEQSEAEKMRANNQFTPQVALAKLQALYGPNIEQFIRTQKNKLGKVPAVRSDVSLSDSWLSRYGLWLFATAVVVGVLALWILLRRRNGLRK